MGAVVVVVVVVAAAAAVVASVDEYSSPMDKLPLSQMSLVLLVLVMMMILLHPLKQRRNVYVGLLMQLLLPAVRV